jgi:hypothetical protein
MYLRDAGRRNDTDAPPTNEWLEDILHFDDYDPTCLHTVGLRGSGEYKALDWELETAWQFGAADAAGALFKPYQGLYGDDDARWHTWAGHAELGMTLPCMFAPRLYAGGAYYDGEDNRDISPLDWLNPFYHARASISFNRLFSAWGEDIFIDASALTNFWKAYSGISASVTDSLELAATLSYFEAVGAFRPPVTQNLSFVTRRGDDSIGWQASLGAVYNYSDSVSFEIGWARFFTGDAIQDTVFVDENGFTNIGGRDSGDVDYVFFLTVLEF